ncbi:MAG: molecular chaperone DnaJ [Alphaproteobacteria bacterium]|nr:molecular chaperone DnaJ [Alphaproteobacteria bacterium]
MDREEDYYHLLGVSRSAKADEIRSAYRRLAMEWHPDRKPGDAEAAEKFKKISRAYSVLRDSEKRATYDRMGHAAFSQAEKFGGSAAMRGGGFGGGMDVDIDISDLVNEVFGPRVSEFLFGGRRRDASDGEIRGGDVEAMVSLTLEEAFHGAIRKVPLNMLVICDLCDGTGSADRSAMQICERCHGRGQEVERRGIFVVQRPCGDCGGLGRMMKSPCRKCRGQGRVEERPEIEIEVPPGAKTGTCLTFPGRGNAAPFGGTAGDLYIVLEVLRHELFERKGETLLLNMPLAFTMAALGGEVEVSGIDGRKLVVQIPSGTQNGSRLRLSGKGMSRLHGEGRGDLLVKFEIEVPRNLRGEQVEHLRRFEESLTAREQPLVSSFGDEAGSRGFGFKWRGSKKKKT